MVAQGLSEKEARNHFYMVDKQGLLFDDMDDLTPEQKPFARARSEFDNPEKLNNLTAAVMAVRPTILVGTSTAPKTFTKEIVKAMASLVIQRNWQKQPQKTSSNGLMAEQWSQPVFLRNLLNTMG